MDAKGTETVRPNPDEFVAFSGTMANGFPIIDGSVIGTKIHKNSIKMLN